MKNDLMKLNIQLFAEEADNDVDNSTESSDAATNDETSIDKTKAFSDRLKAKTQDIEKKAEETYKNKLLSIAKAQGFDSWEDFEKASNTQALRDLGVDEENEEKFQRLVNNAVDKNPDVVKAREIVKRAEEDQRQKELLIEIDHIHKLNEDINSLEDIAKLDTAKDIANLVNKGYGLYDAYRLANYDNILANNSDYAKKQAVEDINSKSHIRTSQGSSGKNTYVPADVYAMYKRNMPKWTDEQIRNHYAKNKED